MYLNNLEQNTLLSTIFNESLDAIVVLDLEIQKFFMFNEKALDLYGYTKEEFKKITPHDLTLEFVSNDKMKEKQELILKKGWDKFISKHKKKDGTIIDVFLKSKKIVLEDNKPFLFITIHDLSKEKELEKEFETIFNSSRDGVLILDNKGKILNFNNSVISMTKYNFSEINNTLFRNLFKSSENHKIDEAIKKVNNLASIENLEIILLTKTQNEIIVYITFNPMPDQKRILITIKNVTTKKMQELEKKIDSLNETITNIAHHWRQPLNNISLIASTLKIKKDIGKLEDKEFDSDLKTILEQTKILSNTIEEFKNLNPFEEEKKELSIVETILKAIAIIEPITKSNQITIIKNLKEDKKISISENKVIQSFLNILNNSIDFLVESRDDKRLIDIETSLVNDNLSLTIKDNAGGIEEEIKDKIFETYFTTKHKSLGTGVGLSYAYKTLKKEHDFNLIVSNCEFNLENEEFKGLSIKIDF